VINAMNETWCNRVLKIDKWKEKKEELEGMYEQLKKHRKYVMMNGGMGHIN